MQHSPILYTLTITCILTACGGNDVSLSISGPGIDINANHYGSQHNNGNNNNGYFTPPQNSGNNNRGNSTPQNQTAQWRRLNGIQPTFIRLDGDGTQRYFPNSSSCQNCNIIPAVDQNNPYYFNGGNGNHRDTTRGGGSMLYQNLSYATFGSYHISGDYYRHFHVLQPTPTSAIPNNGSAHYNGAVIYRNAQGGNIDLNINFASKNVDGNIRGLSAVNGETLDVKASLAGNAINGNVHYNDRELENNVPYSGGILDATLAGPHAEHIVGQFSLPTARFSRNHPENTAVFGANRQ
ncbi:MAG: transferrin-binding protein-like solute binding protein [Cardiobacteriaceae bacterium]|nr:transferrin-binding protein-like solute binding protein [Cardiobacteriaceae bacterium]